MPKYYAIYRVVDMPILGSPPYPESFYDEADTNHDDWSHHILSFASELGNLGKPQIESLVTIVGEKHKIQVCSNWEAN